MGYNVLPAAPRSKVPLGNWKRWQSERIPRRDVERAFAGVNRNIFIITGSISRLAVLDCDTDAALEEWRRRLGDELTTAQVLTGKGHHFYWRLREGQVLKSQSGEGWDFRAEGGGVIAPPSIHESGRAYRWHPEYGPGATGALPSALIDRPATYIAGGVIEAGGEAGRSSLVGLLAAPPVGEGNRNAWLAQVAGHYAKLLPHRDAYLVHVREAAEKLRPPLDAAEVLKTAQSIWSTQDASLARDVQLELKRQRTRAEAKRLLVNERAEAEFKRAPLYSLAELLAMDEPVVEWAVEDLHERGDNTVLTAEYKTGKTTLLLNLIQALADGDRFLGKWQARARGCVCLYDFEMNLPRLHRWFREMRIANAGRVRIIPLRGFRAGFMTDRGRALTIQTLQKHGCSDWIVDPFGRALEANENANDEVRAWLDNMDSIKREAGVENLYMATHTGRVKAERGDERARGATVLDDWTDNRWLLVKTRAGDRYFRAEGRSEGVRDTAIEFDPNTRQLTLQGEVGGYDPRAQEDHKLQTKILQLLSGGRELNTRQLREQQTALRMGGKDKWTRAMDSLVAQGRVVVTPGRTSQERLYRRAKESREEAA